MQDYIGYRVKKRKKKQRKRKKILIPVVVILILALIFYSLGGLLKVSPVDTAYQKTISGFKWLGRKIKGIWPWSAEPKEVERSIPEGKKTANYLIAITKKSGDSTLINSLVVASYDSRDDSGSLIFFPQDTLLEIPGLGMEMLADLVELDGGDITLVLLGVQNLLGVELDRYIKGSDRDLSIFFNEMDSYTVDVPEPLSFKDTSTGAQVDIPEGKQELSGSNLIAYLTYTVPGNDMERIERQKDFVLEFLSQSRKDYDEILPFMEEKAALFESDADSTEMAGLWQAFTLLDSKKMNLVTIPAKVFKIENTVVHRVDMSRMNGFLEKYLKSDMKIRPKRVRVEILNGCGIPGVGGKIAAEVDPDTFDVVRTANADRFDYSETLIIFYDNTQEALDMAEELRSEIGVGRSEARNRTQDVADVTIIAGQDYGNK